MNRILFDRTVSAQPQTFPFVTLPDPVVVPVPDRGENILSLLLTLVCEQNFSDFVIMYSGNSDN